MFSKTDVIYQPNNKIDPYSSYKEGLEAFEQNIFFRKIKNFQRQKLILKFQDLQLNLQ